MNPPDQQQVQNLQAIDLGNGIGVLGVSIVPQVTAGGVVNFILTAHCVRRSSLLVAGVKVVNVMLGPVASLPSADVLKQAVDRELDGEKPTLALVPNQGTDDMTK